MRVERPNRATGAPIAPIGERMPKNGTISVHGHATVDANDRRYKGHPNDARLDRTGCHDSGASNFGSTTSGGIITTESSSGHDDGRCAAILDAAPAERQSVTQSFHKCATRVQCVCVFEVLFKGVSTSVGLQLIENLFKNAYATLCSAVQNLRLGHPSATHPRF